MSKQTPAASRPRSIRCHLLTLLLLLVAVATGQQAQAQTPTPSPWTTTGNDISNTNTGNVGIGTGATAPTEKLVMTGGALFGGVFSRTELWSGFTAQSNPALLELNSGVAGTDNTRFAALSLVTQQPGTAHSIGSIYFSNSAATSIEKRIASIAGSTDGAVNSGALIFSTSNGGSLVERLRINKSGNIGIGTASPLNRLHVADSIRAVGGALYLGPNSATYTGGGRGSPVFGGGPGPEGSGGLGTLQANSHGTTPGGIFYGATNDIVDHWVSPYDAGAGAGIFTVGGTAGVWGEGGAGIFAQGGQNGNQNPLYINSNYVYAPALFSNGYSLIGSTDGRHTGLAIGGDVTNPAFLPPANGLYVQGNVGIGTTTPAYKLDVAGAIRSSSGGIVFPDGTTQTTAATAGGGGGVWGETNTRTEFRDNAGAGGDGIKSGFYQTSAPLAGSWPTGATNWWHLLDVRHSNTANNYAMQFAGSFFNQELFFRKTNDSATTAWSKVVLQDSGGNISVGTTNSSVLTVQGNITVNGNINAKYQDVAEWVESSQQLASGTVVILDPDKSNQVLASARAYDTSVAGVVSARPGIALGEGGADKVLVATTGRVKVKVDATHAPIKIGDLLVTSDVVGVAMKSEPITVGGRRLHTPGTLIGKALEPLATGIGEILVLLSLQ